MVVSMVDQSTAAIVKSRGGVRGKVIVPDVISEQRQQRCGAS